MKKTVLVVSLVILMILPSMGELHNQEKPLILFDEAHIEMDINIQIPDFVQELKNRGYTVDYLKDQITPAALSECDVFVLYMQIEEFSESEIEGIVDFVESGGGLIVFGEHGGVIRSRGLIDTVNQIPEVFGIEFNQDIAEDEESNDGNVCWPIISKFKNHPVTKNVRSVVYGCGCSLELESSKTALAFGNETTTAGEQLGEDVILLAATGYGEGRVVIIGDSNFVVGPNTKSQYTGDRDFLSLADNKKLALNMFEWAARPSSETLPPETPPSEIDTTEADSLASQGYDLFYQRKYSSAKTKFEKALEIYSNAGEGEEVSDMQTMIDKCKKGVDADVAYRRGMDYYNSEDCESAKREFQDSKSLHNAIGNNTGSEQAQSMIDECDRCITAQKAKAASEKGEEYLNNKDYDNAKTEFETSKSLYDEVGDSVNAGEAQSKIVLCDKYIKARDAYKTAEEYYSKEQYEEALTRFEEAQMLYEELGDTESVGELQDKIGDTQEAIQKRAARNKMLVLIGIGIGIAVVFVIVVIFVRKPPKGKPKLGIPRAETMYCPHCGKENIKGASHCEHCRKPIRSMDELEKEKAIETLREKYARGDISEEEYHKAMKGLEEAL